MLRSLLDDRVEVLDDLGLLLPGLLAGVGLAEPLLDLAHLLDDLRQRAGPLAFLFLVLVLLLPPRRRALRGARRASLSSPFSSSGSGLSGLSAWAAAGSSAGSGPPGAACRRGRASRSVSPSFSSRLSSAWSLGATSPLPSGSAALRPRAPWRASAPRPARRASAGSGLLGLLELLEQAVEGLVLGLGVLRTRGRSRPRRGWRRAPRRGKQAGSCSWSFLPVVLLRSGQVTCEVGEGPLVVVQAFELGLLLGGELRRRGGGPRRRRRSVR